MKKQILPEGVINIDFEPHIWEFVEKGVLPQVNIEGLVDLNTGGKARIHVKVDTMHLVKESDNDEFSPKLSVPQNVHENDIGDAFLRVFMVMMKFVLTETDHWYMLGTVSAGNGSYQRPVFIMYSCHMKKGFYALKRLSGTKNTAETSNINPRLN